MSSGCEGCFTSARGQQQELERVRALAKNQAEQDAQTMAIYKEGFEYRYGPLDRAVADGCNVIEVVQKYR